MSFRSHAKGAFCAGADLKERAKMTPDEVERMPHFVNLEMHMDRKYIRSTGGTFRCTWQRNNWSLGETANARHSSPGWGEEDILWRDKGLNFSRLL